MSEDLELGLEAENAVTNNPTETKKKVQTADARETLEAGVAQIKETEGVSDELKIILDLVPEWNGAKEDLPAFKDAVIEKFGSSEKLKNYVEEKLPTDMMPFNGIAKAMPVLNNIRVFYARRKSSKKQMVQVLIEGTPYSVNAAYKEEIEALPVDEKKELLLTHVDTKSAPKIEEIL